jgi:hypothetical protein
MYRECGRELIKICTLQEVHKIVWWEELLEDHYLEGRNLVVTTTIGKALGERCQNYWTLPEARSSVGVWLPHSELSYLLRHCTKLSL